VDHRLARHDLRHRLGRDDEEADGGDGEKAADEAVGPDEAHDRDGDPADDRPEDPARQAHAALVRDTLDGLLERDDLCLERGQGRSFEAARQTGDEDDREDRQKRQRRVCRQ
jgi:hypothetical protein